MIRWPAVALLVTLGACGPAADDPGPPARTSPPSTATATPTPSNPTPSNPTPSNPASARPLRLSLADDGRTITMGIGDEAFLTLGGGFDWSDPQLAGTTVSISEQVSDEATSSRTWEVVAHTRGRTDMTVAGSPTCRSTTPPCLAPDRAFTLSFEVLAPDP